MRQIFRSNYSYRFKSQRHRVHKTYIFPVDSTGVAKTALENQVNLQEKSSENSAIEEDLDCSVVEDLDPITIGILDEGQLLHFAILHSLDKRNFQLIEALAGNGHVRNHYADVAEAARFRIT